MVNLEQTINELHDLNAERDAFSSISGYFFQFELTLLHILYDGSEKDAFSDKECKATYKVETIEDYVKYYKKDDKGYIRLAQMKHHVSKTTNSKYYSAVLSLYYTYLNFIEKNETNIELRATIFHYDMSPVKDIYTVLTSAIESEDKSLQSIITKIIDTGLDSEVNRLSFSQITSFEKTETHASISQILKQELSNRYQSLHPNHTPERLYASAVSKLIQDSGNGLDLSIETLNSLFLDEVEIMKGFYQLKIIDYVKGIIDSCINEVDINFRYTEEVKTTYAGIYVDFIAPFIEVKFQHPEFRYSFLRTVTPKEFSKAIELNSLSEYESFLEASDAIKQTLSNLAKIIFNYLSSGEEIRLEDWFEITEKGWLFDYPSEERGKGVLIGNFYGDIFSSLYYMLPRLKDRDLRPDVWYVKHDDVDINASNQLNYEVDITSPSEDLHKHIYAQPFDDHYHIQCLGCLTVSNLSDCKKVNNIFIDQCRVKGV
ncbi:hypothetical protein [Fictibacillus terranigra]|uniref:PD-(D/E)XK nuclease superfamily protein n=1 Tax=Fictibacillus terranigra TaxID=3058424 RepID=A0ABT8ED38_9BACL|nr:hypothetical protein [Fictibacillus sp. CENA-BCM004]MDN4075851.1 hypothetical protein [Fictibacillus sp. CENA-BCM004]